MLTRPNSADLVSAFLWTQLSTQTKAVLKDPNTTEEALQTAVTDGFNHIIECGRSIHNETRFAKVALTPSILSLLEKKPTGGKLVRLNRRLLEAAYPEELIVNRKPTTPAMRLGLARGPVDYQDILRFNGQR